MVVKMMKWRPWPPPVTKKYDVKLIVKKLEGWDLVRQEPAKVDGCERLTVEIRWKGPKVALSSLRRTVKRNFTKEAEDLEGNGVVYWEDEEFHGLCTLSAYKDNMFHPWEIGFTVFSSGLQQGTKNKIPVVGTALLNIAEYTCVSDRSEYELAIPLTLSSGFLELHPTLCISLGLVEIRTSQHVTESPQRALVPAQSGETVSTREHMPNEKGEISAIKAGLRKVKILTEYVATRRAKKACREESGSEGRSSARSEYGENNYPFDSDSLDDFEDGQSDEGKEDPTVRKSFSYGPLAYANHGSFYSTMGINDGDEDWVYYSNRKSDLCCSNVEDSVVPAPESISKRSILPWRKRKLSFRSPKAKGEPLLKKAYGEEGGDDIDYDRRQLSSDEALSLGKTDEEASANRSSFSEFGDDNFAIGTWEHREVISRDGHMKLQAEVFHASIDQRSERAAGESACTALVAVIADWLQNNHDLMPIRSQFDSLIREGSLEWRSLCENEKYREKFPDKHFDLETVLQAEIRPLTVVPGKSFIGFFHPDGMDEGRFDFLQGAMSFDNIWDEIIRDGPKGCSDDEPHVYIVSWNDHFFILKVEAEAYYIIDTLGERLYEGCNQAYILKFDKDTVIHKLSGIGNHSSDSKPSGDMAENNAESENHLAWNEDSAANKEQPRKTGGEEEVEVVCRGKESCKEYIKNFLAAIPIRELQADIKKGLVSSTPLHHRLQFEFHYTKLSQPPPLEVPCMRAGTNTVESTEVSRTDAITASRLQDVKL